MGRKRPWQAVTLLVLPDANRVSSKSFVTHEQALAWGAEWMQAHGPDNPFRPTVVVAHRETRGWPDDELLPEEYQLHWAPEHRALVQMTWPAKTPHEAMGQMAQVLDSALQGEAGTRRRVLRVIAVAPGGDEALIGHDVGTLGHI